MQVWSLHLVQPCDAPLVLISELFDSHDDRDDDPEGESVEEHKSVIMHLLSQVRLGMDLTKVNTAALHADWSPLRIRGCNHCCKFNCKMGGINRKKDFFSVRVRSWTSDVAATI